MDNKILDGNKLSKNILEDIKNKVSKLEKRPHLVVISVGDNAESKLYIQKKQEAANAVGYIFTHLHFDNTTTEELMIKMDEINKNPEIDGMIVQLPLPENIDDNLIKQSIAPWIDVDGLHPLSKGLLDTAPTLIPPTTYGVLLLLEDKNIDLQGMNVVVIGEGDIAGKPTARLLSSKGATVTTCNKFTKDISMYTKNADLIVTAVGKENLIKPEDVKEGVILINIGITRKENEIKGDFDYEAMFDKASFITPTPGGTGPMTVACLMYNTLLCYNLKNNK